MRACSGSGAPLTLPVGSRGGDRALGVLELPQQAGLVSIGRRRVNRLKGLRDLLLSGEHRIVCEQCERPPPASNSAHAGGRGEVRARGVGDSQQREGGQPHGRDEGGVQVAAPSDAPNHPQTIL